MNAMVFRARTRPGFWHWANGSHSACTGSFLDLARSTDPVSVDLRDRCQNHGCRVRWDEWLRGTLIRALADWNGRQADEIDRLTAALTEVAGAPVEDAA